MRQPMTTDRLQKMYRLTTRTSWGSHIGSIAIVHAIVQRTVYATTVTDRRRDSLPIRERAWEKLK